MTANYNVHTVWFQVSSDVNTHFTGGSIKADPTERVLKRDAPARKHNDHKMAFVTANSKSYTLVSSYLLPHMKPFVDLLQKWCSC